MWVIVNVEEWNPLEPLPRTVLTPPAGGSPMPDVPNWAWHEYGNRVGFWRMLEVFDRLHVPAVLAINGSAIQAYEPIARAALERQWEFIGHGFSQKNMQKVADERADIQKTTAAIDVIHRTTAARVAGTWPDRDVGHARHPGGGRVRIRVRLGARRPAGARADANGIAGQRAVHAGVQRRRDDAHPASHGVGISGPCHRSVRSAVLRTLRTPLA